MFATGDGDCTLLCGALHSALVETDLEIEMQSTGSPRYAVAVECGGEAVLF